MATRYKMEIAYEGTLFRGWQQQHPEQEQKVPSIAALITTAAQKAAANQEAKVHGSGRTDVGVHARGQTAHLEVETRLAPEVLLRAMNSYLPPQIRLLSLVAVAADFHAQKHVRRKCYRYFILQKVGANPSTWPFLQNWCWYMPNALDTKAMESGLQALVGKHDFAAFQNIGTPVAHTVREIFSAQLIAHDWQRSNPGNLPWFPRADSGLQLLEFSFCGKGFLKQMVRNIVGTLVEVGKGKITAEEIQGILASKSREHAGPTAPGHGLILENVEY